MVLMMRPYSWMARVSWFWRADACRRDMRREAGRCPWRMVAAVLSMGVPVVDVPGGVDAVAEQHRGGGFGWCGGGSPEALVGEVSDAG